MSIVANKLCRICITAADNLQLVFQNLDDASTIAQIIFECTALQVAEGDGLPEFVCRSCLNELKKFHKFVLKARASDRTLRSLRREKVDVKLEKSTQDCEGGEPEFAMVADEKVDENFSSEDEVDVKVDDDQNQHNLHLKMFEVIDVDRGKLLCCTCLKQFEDENNLQVHHNENHSNDDQFDKNKKFVCKFCKRFYSSAIALRAHRRKMELISNIFECEMCKIRVLSPQKCIQHAKTHHQKKSTERGSRQEKSQPSLEELIERQGRLCCALGCSEVFETESQLISHAHAAHKISRIESSLAEEKPVECKICFKRFKDEECLQRHLRFRYQPSKNICILCGAKFPSLSSLEIHERSHTKEKPFKCEICSKAFGDKQSLKRHQVKHTDEKPFMCSICGASFKRKRAMQSHMIMHVPGELPFKCDHCEKRFRIRAKMVYHMRTHTGEKPYQCRHCDKSFADFTNRIRHEMQHTGERPYKCSYCPQGFITRRFKLEHEKSHKRKET